MKQLLKHESLSDKTVKAYDTLRYVNQGYKNIIRSLGK